MSFIPSASCDSTNSRSTRSISTSRFPGCNVYCRSSTIGQQVSVGFASGFSTAKVCAANETVATRNFNARKIDILGLTFTPKNSALIQHCVLNDGILCRANKSSALSSLRGRAVIAQINVMAIIHLHLTLEHDDNAIMSELRISGINGKGQNEIFRTL